MLKKEGFGKLLKTVGNVAERRVKERIGMLPVDRWKEGRPRLSKLMEEMLDEAYELYILKKK